MTDAELMERAETMRAEAAELRAQAQSREAEAHRLEAMIGEPVKAT
jgi:ribosomal protein L29